MRAWLSNTLATGGAVGASWGAAVWHWRATNRMPSDVELAGALVVLPLVLLLAFWGGKKILAAAAASSAAGAAAGDAAAPAQPAPAASPAPVMLAGALRMPHGASAEELAEAILSKKARPDLDPELQDDDGFPVLSGRVADVDELAQQELMVDWLALQAQQPHFETEHWRALALGSAVVAELAAHAMLHPLLPAYRDAQPAARAAQALPVLQLLPLLPDEWDEGRRQGAANWLLHLVVAQGWPAERAVLAAPAGADRAAPFQRIGQLAAQHAQAQLPYLSIVLACASHISGASVAAWAARGTLFTAANPDGAIPGEGAAGLLLADAAQALLIDADAAIVLHAAAAGRRATSADAAGRTDTTLLAELGETALRSAAPGSAAVGLLAADTDQRSSRVAELMGMANTALPELDPSSQFLSVAASGGSAGAVPAVATLVLARHAAAQPEPAPQVLCVSNLDAFQRSAVLVGRKAAAPATAALETA